MVLCRFVSVVVARREGISGGELVTYLPHTLMKHELDLNWKNLFFHWAHVWVLGVFACFSGLLWLLGLASGARSSPGFFTEIVRTLAPCVLFACVAISTFIAVESHKRRHAIAEQQKRNGRQVSVEIFRSEQHFRDRIK